ncbi:MAG: nickel-responsive transcriptional regulator NikR [Conexivisphaerales archaeon]|jgi:CopG family nickel-responsive transcriptional regulator
MHPRGGVARVSLSLPPELLSKFDEAATRAGFKDRSKALQATMRDFITEQAQTLRDDSPITGSLLVLYDHETRGIDAALTDLEHHSMRLITSSIHVHMDSKRCLKIIVLRGRFGEMKVLERNLRNLRGVLQLRVSFLKTESD